MNIISKEIFISKDFSIKKINQFSLSITNSAVSGKGDVNKGVGIMFTR